jgi:predicted permease
MWKDLRLRARALFLRCRVDKELEEELSFHVEMLARKHAAAGRSDGDARQLARAQFGSLAFVRDLCRDVRGVGLIETTWQDVRYAVRGFRRAPIFAITVIGTIALGLGINTAVFTLVNAYMFRPPAVSDPDSLYLFTYTNHAGRGHAFSWPEYQTFQRENPVFTEIFGSAKQFIARIDGRVALGQLVTGNYFRMLGVGAAVGRTLVPDDTAQLGGRSVIVLSHAFWQRQFAGDPSVLGKRVVIRGHPCEVIGVAREGFVGWDILPHDFWVPVTLASQLMDGADFFGPEQPGRLEIVGRLKRGFAKGSATAALELWSRRMTAQRSDNDRAVRVILESRATSIPFVPQIMLVLTPVVVAFGLVLVIACANVANMMLARAMARQREIGTRLSLGASRARIIRQLLTESVLLAVPAAVVAFVISSLTVDLSLRAMVATLPPQAAEYIRLMPLTPDLRVFAFSVAAGLLSALLSGLAPAVQSTRAELVQTARGDFMYDIRPARARSTLVIVQIAASALLLICAAVLLRGANAFARVNTGLRTFGVADLEIQEKSRTRVLAVLSEEPVVLNVAAMTPGPPLSERALDMAVGPVETPNLVSTGVRYTSAEYFSVFDIPLSGGRGFTQEEGRAGAAVAIVSQSAARRFWPDAQAIGRSLRIVWDERTTLRDERVRRYQTVRVIGIARDVLDGYSNEEMARVALYLPTSPQEPGARLLVRVNGDPETAIRTLDGVLTARVPGGLVQIFHMQTFANFRMYPFRVASWASTVVGSLALLLTLSGIYGVLSYLVTQRAKEIGIRMALGAEVRHVTALVMSQSLRLAGAGLAVGALFALGVSKILATRLVMMNTFDALAYVSGSLVVLAACLAAACVPTVRAARVDPISALRHD